MRSNVVDKEPGQVTLAQDEGAKRKPRAGRRPGAGQRAVMTAHLAWTISLMDDVSRTEADLAETLRAMAASGGSQAAARRLGLAEAAIKGSREAAERSELLRRHADRLARHADVAALLHSVDHAGQVLADLASTEKNIAYILTRLAGRGDPDWAAQLRHKAQEALAEAQHANDRTRSLYHLADSAAKQE